MAFDNKQPVELSVYILITREWQNICPYIDISLAMVWEQYFSKESAECVNPQNVNLQPALAYSCLEGQVIQHNEAGIS